MAGSGPATCCGHGHGPIPPSQTRVVLSGPTQPSEAAGGEEKAEKCCKKKKTLRRGRARGQPGGGCDGDRASRGDLGAFDRGWRLPSIWGGRATVPSPHHSPSYRGIAHLPVPPGCPPPRQESPCALIAPPSPRHLFLQPGKEQSLRWPLLTGFPVNANKPAPRRPGGKGELGGI